MSNTLFAEWAVDQLLVEVQLTLLLLSTVCPIRVYFSDAIELRLSVANNVSLEEALVAIEAFLAELTSPLHIVKTSLALFHTSINYSLATKINTKMNVSR